jgi:hypothetical protein
VTHERVWARRALASVGLLATVAVGASLPVHAAPGSGVRAAPTQGGTEPLAVWVSVDQPFDVGQQVTDRAGVLGADLSSVQAELDALRDEHGLQLFAVFVDSFDGASGEAWAEQTYRVSGMGGNDVLLAVAVRDRRYATWTTSTSGLTAQDDEMVRARFIEPALARDDWSGAVTAAAEGYGRVTAGGLGQDSTNGASGVGVPWWLLVPVAGGALFAVSRRRAGTSRPPGRHIPGQPPGETAAAESVEDLRRRAASALVVVDDAVRSSADELVFAEAQFGVQVTRRFIEGARRGTAQGRRGLPAAAHARRPGGRRHPG